MSRNAHGDVIGVVGVGQDITELNQVQGYYRRPSGEGTPPPFKLWSAIDLWCARKSMRSTTSMKYLFREGKVLCFATRRGTFFTNDDKSKSETWTFDPQCMRDTSYVKKGLPRRNHRIQTENIGIWSQRHAIMQVTLNRASQRSDKIKSENIEIWSQRHARIQVMLNRASQKSDKSRVKI